MTDRRRADKRDRANARQRFLVERAGDFDRAAVEKAAAGLATTTLQKVARGDVLPKGFPTGDEHRWVPIGPSVVRRGQANGRPRVSGRIRDLAVSADGTRAYAASAMGGAWYSGDGGSTWDPVGGWTEHTLRGGDNNAQACGCILVDFGATAADDFVLVGTGETVPSTTATGHQFGGLGVLAAHGPAARDVEDNPWEEQTGSDVLHGAGMFRLARRPGRRAGSSDAADRDQVLAATSRGLFLGTRTRVATPAPHDEFVWSKPAGLGRLVFGPPPLAVPLPPLTGSPAVTDVLWLSGGTDGRIVVAVEQFGVAISDDLGATFRWMRGFNSPTAGVAIQGYSSLAMTPGTNRMYILSALPLAATASPSPRQDDTPALWQVADMTVAEPTAVRVPGVPATLWPGQRDYDQALTVDVVGPTDRVYLGGSTISVTGQWVASLWAFDVAAGPTLVPASGVSRTGAPAPGGGGGDGAVTAGLIGNDVHADVHAIRLAGTTPSRQVWVACDGGVYVSARAGRVNTFASRATGLAALQAGFVAAHPSSSHFVAAGFQDNGTQVRSGDTLWEEILLGDGGGVAFHPRRSQLIVAQYIRAGWYGAPSAGFVSPTSRVAGGGAAAGDREHARGNSLFYSGASAVSTSATEGRIAVGTARVWMTDNLGAASPNRWWTLPFPSGPLTDPRPGGADAPDQQAVGVPTLAAGDIDAAGVGPLGMVVTLRWVSGTELLVLFQDGVVRWRESPAGQWTATVLVGTGAVAAALLTDLFPIPGGTEFFVTTTGNRSDATVDTCYRYDSATSALVGTGLRGALPAPSPLEPAYSVTVDPGAPTDVYVGTVTGVWRGERDTATGGVGWDRFMNGMPQAAVQDLSVWTDPSGADGGPRLLRAAVQARGVWEVDLAVEAEPVRTYLRVHPRDDRRRLPTPMANPRLRPTAAPERVYASPDIVVRPRMNPAAAPPWLLGEAVIDQGNVRPYQLWTFQTAFRWLYPSVVADGQFTDAFGDLVELHRTVLRPLLGPPELPLGRFIDARMWDAVVGGTRLHPATGAISTSAAHPLAGYRPAWHTPTAMAATATEVDLLETVQPRSVVAGTWQVHSEPSTVDVLLHHRDTRPLPPSNAFAILLWRSGAGAAGLLATRATGIATFARNLAAGNAATTPAGWTLQSATNGGALHGLPVALDARLPRAVSIDVDLSDVDQHHRVLMLAIVGSPIDPCTFAPVGLPASATVTDLVRRWPYAALRMVRVAPRA